MAVGKVECTTIDEYIAAFPAEIQDILRRLRTVIKAAAPDAEERMSYRMPTFWQNGNLIHFAAFKHHIGVYPTPHGISEFREELSKYEGAKGSIRFPLDAPMPYDLIARIVRFRVAQSLAKAKAKKSKPVNIQ